MKDYRERIEKKTPKICKEWLYMQKCKECLFETLCRLKEAKKKREEEDNE